MRVIASQKLPRDSSAKRGLPLPLGRGVCETKSKNGRSRRRKPFYFWGFSVLRGGFRPWSQTMVSEGARPWGRGRSGDCEQSGPTNSQSIAVKEFWFSRVEFEVLMCGGICVKFLVANFPGN